MKGPEPPIQRGDKFPTQERHPPRLVLPGWEFLLVARCGWLSRKVIALSHHAAEAFYWAESSFSAFGGCRAARAHAGLRHAGWRRFWLRCPRRSRRRGSAGKHECLHWQEVSLCGDLPSIVDEVRVSECHVGARRNEHDSSPASAALAPTETRVPEQTSPRNAPTICPLELIPCALLQVSPPIVPRSVITPVLPEKCIVCLGTRKIGLADRSPAIVHRIGLSVIPAQGTQVL